MFTKNKLASTRQTTKLHDKIRVLFVEDHQVMREALIVLMEASDDVVVSDTASTAEEALEKIHNDLDLVILDISLPGRDGIWLARMIKAEKPSLPVMVLSMHEHADFVLKALESGVDGYLTKWTGQRELLKAIRSVVGNGSYLQSRIAPLVIDALRRRVPGRKVVLSEREHEIARCLVNGQSNSDISRKIGLSVGTVKANLRSLYSKLEVTGRTEAAAAVVEKGIVCRE